MGKLWQRVWKPITVIATIVVILGIYFLLNGGDRNYKAKYQGHELSYTSSELGGRSNTYLGYVERYADAAKPAEVITVDIFATENSEGVSAIDNFEGEPRVLRTEEDSTARFVVNVPKAGLYTIYTEYFPVKSRGVAMERALHINGALPFLGSEALTFQRVWGDTDGEIRMDNQGNTIRPTQIEKPRWEGSYFSDYTGYQSEPYMFYFEQGENTIELLGVNEPLVIRSLQLMPVKKTPSYKDYISTINVSDYQNKQTDFRSIYQGEDAQRRSSPSLYALYDRSSPITEPYNIQAITLNTIGGNPWSVAGQWIEWDIEVPENGMYRFTIKARQGYNRGFISNRSVIIDNELLFSEISAVPYFYSNEWEILTLKDTAGEDLYIPLTAGTHTFRMQVTLGELGELLTIMEESVFRLNEMYRKVLVLTGAEPDQYRDYAIKENYPEVVRAMEQEMRILYKLVDDLTAYTEERSPQAASALTLARQLEVFVDDPEKIPSKMKAFRINISALGTAMVTLASAPLDIDYIAVSASGAALPDEKESFLNRSVHEVKSFFTSFTVDYNHIGNIYTGDTTVEAWILSGRDQSTILKTMIDDTFTPNTNISVNIKLVGPEAVMPSVVAGTGPDLVLTCGNADPVNYALRKAAVNIAEMPGFEEAASEFYESALVPFRYKDGVYGLPETQIYNVMFYRSDIFAELGIEPPNTWDDLIRIIPVIQGQSMDIGIPSVDRQDPPVPDLSNYFAQLYQHGGTLYNEDQTQTLLAEQASVEAFEVYTRFFTHYKTPLIYNFVNQFRSGIMPIGFADFNTCNTLAVFAPEIRGLWEIAPLPGTPQEDGSINRSTSSWGQACMIVANAKNQEGAWDFMKWWVSGDTQARFGRELEAVMGSAARYVTANRNAFEQLSWSAKQADTLRTQWEAIVGTPEVPGGYYASRHIVNASRKIINKKEDVRETLLDYARMINAEMEKKRAEFEGEE